MLIEPDVSNFHGYIKLLLHGKQWFYRLNLFIVNTHIITPTTTKVSYEQAADWFGQGSLNLPYEIKKQPYSNHYQCTALVYEFEKLDIKPEAYIKFSPRLSASTHLKQADLKRLF